MFTLAIAVHLFSDIVLNTRLGPLRFLSLVISIWIFTIFCASIGIAMHPTDFYMRAGLWCWIPENRKCLEERSAPKPIAMGTHASMRSIANYCF